MDQNNKSNNLYHYTNHLFEILKSNKLWFSSTLSVDDITEKYFGVSALIPIIYELNNPYAEELRNNLSFVQMQEINNAQLSIDTYSLSCCEYPNNDYLWENYAKSDSGCCISFNFDVLREYIDELIEKYVDKDCWDSLSIIECRGVDYGLKTKKVEDGLNLTHSVFDNPTNTNEDDIEKHVLWYKLLLGFVYGVIKPTRFENECEMRLFIKDTNYCDECLLFSEVYKILGTNEPFYINGRWYKQVEFPEDLWQKGLIQKIIINKGFNKTEELALLLRDKGMKNTIIEERGGNIIWQMEG